MGSFYCEIRLIQQRLSTLLVALALAACSLETKVPISAGVGPAYVAIAS